MIRLAVRWLLVRSIMIPLCGRGNPYIGVPRTRSSCSLFSALYYRLASSAIPNCRHGSSLIGIRGVGGFGCIPRESLRAQPLHRYPGSIPGGLMWSWMPTDKALGITRMQLMPKGSIVHRLTPNIFHSRSASPHIPTGYDPPWRSLEATRRLF